jgi:hypothetical protein
VRNIAAVPIKTPAKRHVVSVLSVVRSSRRAPIRGTKARVSDMISGERSDVAVMNSTAAAILALLSEVNAYVD